VTRWPTQSNELFAVTDALERNAERLKVALRRIVSWWARSSGS